MFQKGWQKNATGNNSKSLNPTQAKNEIYLFKLKIEIIILTTKKPKNSIAKKNYYNTLPKNTL
jgi:hypothetical protein